MRTNTPWLMFRSFLFVLCLLFFSMGFQASPVHARSKAEIPNDVILVLQDLLDETGTDDTVTDSADVDIARLLPLMNFLRTEKSPDTVYETDGVLDMAAAFHTFSVKTDLSRLIDYTVDENIPAVCFWPSSIRLSAWTAVSGGKDQLVRFREAAARPDATFIANGVEHIEITPDQHSGAYYVYDVNKKMMLFPHEKGRVLIVISRQKGLSEVGLRGWVIGDDADWTYVYTKDRGINMTGLGWAKTYMYDSFGVTVYWQKDLDVAEVTYSVISGVNAGWASMNMVKSHHIHNGLVRVAQAFREVMEHPGLPAPSALSEIFSRSDALSTETLQKYALDYFQALGQRIDTLDDVPKALKKDFDPPVLVNQMSRNALISLLALDYLKKVLNRNPVLENHPFTEY